MPKPRIELGTLLREISENVYFQPPESIRMRYPALIYALDNIQNIHADNSVYMQDNRYSIMVIDKNPDSALVNAVSWLPRTRFERSYISDNLYHTVFSIYY